MPDSWSLQARLLALLSLVAAALAALGAASLWALHRVADDMGAVQQRRLVPLVQLDAIGRGLERQRAKVLATLAATDDLMVAALEKQVAADALAMPRTIAALRDAAGDAAERSAYDRFAAALTISRAQGLREVLERLRKGQFVEADVASQAHYRPQMDATSRALDELIGIQVDLARRDHETAEGLVRSLTLFLGAAALVGLALGVAAVAGLSRAVQRVLGAHERDLAEGASRIARGDLVHSIALRSGDRSSVAANLNAMAESFSRLVDDAAGSAQRVSATAGRLSEASRDLATRTSGQAANLEQTAASMEQLASTVQQNRDRAEQAHRLADDASRVAGHGAESVSEVAATMQGIATASRQIGEIVGLIDGISFQTNILALNAAVEAARAGQEGRGFAVVAAEVRALSQRTAAAARQIRDLSEDSMQRTQAGTALAGAAGATMADLRSSVNQLSGLVEEIALASREQAAGVLEVNRAVEQLDSVTQSNAALAESVDADAQELAAQAGALESAVTRFSQDADEPASMDENLVADAPSDVFAPRGAAPALGRNPALDLVPARKWGRRAPVADPAPAHAQARC